MPGYIYPPPPPSARPQCGDCHHWACPTLILPLSKRGSRDCGDCQTCLLSAPEPHEESA